MTVLICGLCIQLMITILWTNKLQSLFSLYFDQSIAKKKLSKTMYNGNSLCDDRHISHFCRVYFLDYSKQPQCFCMRVHIFFKACSNENMEFISRNVNYIFEIWIKFWKEKKKKHSRKSLWNTFFFDKCVIYLYIYSMHCIAL